MQSLNSKFARYSTGLHADALASIYHNQGHQPAIFHAEDALYYDAVHLERSFRIHGIIDQIK